MTFLLQMDLPSLPAQRACYDRSLAESFDAIGVNAPIQAPVKARMTFQ